MANRDPTRTTLLRRQFMAEMNKRFRKLRGEINRLIVEEDAFGLGKTPPIFQNTRFKFITNPEKISEFQKWLKIRVDAGILNVGPEFADEPWTAKFMDSAYKKGLVRSYTDSHAESLAQSGDFFKGGKASFLESAFNSPTSVQTLEMLGTRTFTDLKGITDNMSRELSKHLMDGVSQGSGPREIARQMNKTITGMTKQRALTLARTEVVRAHAEGQLDGFTEMNIDEVIVMAEWSTAADDRVCPQCEPLEGVVMKVKAARGLLPRHPNCVIGSSIIDSPDTLALMKGNYTGKIFKVTTASGREIAITSNHMLLTNFGFVQARHLQKGFKLLDANPGQRMLPGYPDDNGGVPSIADYFATFSKDVSMTSDLVPIAPENLHGEGSALNSEINIVFPHRKLRDGIDVGIDQHSVEDSFPVLQLGRFEGQLSTEGSFAEFFRSIAFTADSTMGVRRDLQSFFLGESLSKDFALLRNGSDRNPCFLEFSGDGAAMKSIPYTQLYQAISALAVMDSIVDIEVLHVVDLPVYDVTTDSTVYSLNGVIASNCRCAWIPADPIRRQPGQHRSPGALRTAFGKSARAEVGKRSTRQSVWKGSRKVPKGQKKLPKPAAKPS